MDTMNTIAIPAPNKAIFGTENSMTPSGTSEFRNGVWYNGIGLESTAIHPKVSKIWQEQCVPFLDFADGINAAARLKVDDTVLLSGVRISDDLKMGFEGSDKLREFGEMGFTPHGLNSLGVRCGVKGGVIEFLNEENFHPELATVLNTKLSAAYTSYWDKKALKANPSDKDKSVFIRTRPDDDGQVIRATLSDRYGECDNDWLINAITESLPQGAEDALASHLYHNGDNMNGNILLPDYMKTYPDSDYGVGIAFRNSEIGQDRVTIDAFLFRAICLNGCIWGRRDSTIAVNKKHLGTIDLNELRGNVMKLITLALSEGNDLLTQMEYSRDTRIPVEMVAPTIISLGEINKLNKPQIKNWYKGFVEEPMESGFGIVNGLTRAAQGYSGDVRYELESLAGRILTDDITADKGNMLTRWNKILDRASHVEQKVVAEFMNSVTAN